MLFFAIWFFLCVAIGVGAEKRGRNGVGWFVFAFFLSPLIAGVFLLAVGPKVEIVPVQPTVDWSTINWDGSQTIENVPSAQLTPVWVVVVLTVGGMLSLLALPFIAFAMFGS